MSSNQKFVEVSSGKSPKESKEIESKTFTEQIETLKTKYYFKPLGENSDDLLVNQTSEMFEKPISNNLEIVIKHLESLRFALYQQHQNIIPRRPMESYSLAKQTVQKAILFRESLRRLRRNVDVVRLIREDLEEITVSFNDSLNTVESLRLMVPESERLPKFDYFHRKLTLDESNKD